MRQNNWPLGVDILSDPLLSHLAYEERESIEPIARSGLSLS
jgi:hypothetical protein